MDDAPEPDAEPEPLVGVADAEAELSLEPEPELDEEEEPELLELSPVVVALELLLEEDPEVEVDVEEPEEEMGEQMANDWLWGRENELTGAATGCAGRERRARGAVSGFGDGELRALRQDALVLSCGAHEVDLVALARGDILHRAQVVRSFGGFDVVGDGSRHGWVDSLVDELNLKAGGIARDRGPSDLVGFGKVKGAPLGRGGHLDSEGRGRKGNEEAQRGLHCAC